MKKHLVTLFGLILFCNGVANAQMDDSVRFYYPEFDEALSHKLLFNLENVNFVKNNEYKNLFFWGHTLLGYGIEPSLMYYVGDRLRLKAGLFLQQYSGLDHYNKVLPVLSAHLRLSPSVDMVMGALRGHIHHRVIEPLFEPERQYTRPVETGVQFLVKRPWLSLDTWVDWEQFIHLDDDFPEKFTVGLSADAGLINRADNAWQVSLPLNVIANHRGGEISDYPEPVQTSVNIAAGAKVNYQGAGQSQKVGVFGYDLYYRNINDVGLHGVNQGYGYYVGATASGRHSSFMFGYFNAHDFVALCGSGLFLSVSQIMDNVYIPDREILTLKARFQRVYMKKIKFSVLLEGYYDLPARRLDFASGIQLAFNPQFVIADLNFF